MLTFTPLLIGLLVSIWYTFCLFVTVLIYFWIFKWFTCLGGRTKARKLLRSPKKNLEDLIDYLGLKHADKVYKAVEDNDSGKRKSKLSIDKKWIERFIQLCHWAGYQVVIRKDSTDDIELEDSESFDMEYLKELGSKFVAFNQKTKEFHRTFEEDNEKLKKQFEL